MGEVAFDDFLDSEKAVLEYYKMDKENREKHKSKIVIKRGGGIVYNNNLDVMVRVPSDAAKIIVYGDDEYDEEFNPDYSSKYDYYSIQGSSLVVRSKDQAGRDIEVTISSAL